MTTITLFLGLWGGIMSLVVGLLVWGVKRTIDNTYTDLKRLNHVVEAFTRKLDVITVEHNHTVKDIVLIKKTCENRNVKLTDLEKRILILENKKKP